MRAQLEKESQELRRQRAEILLAGEREKDQLSVTVTSLESQLRDLGRASERDALTLISVRSDMAEQTAERDKADGQRDVAETKTAQSVQELNEARQQLQGLDRQLGEKEAACAGFRAQLDAAEARNRELETTLHTTRVQCESLATNMAINTAGQEQCESMSRQMLALQSDKRLLERELQDAKNCVQRIQDDADAKQNLLGSELHEVRQELMSVREARSHQNEVQTAKTLELQARVSQAQNLHRMEEDRARHLEAELNNKLEEAKRAVSEIERSTLVANRAQEELASMHEMVSQTEARAQALEGTCTALRHNVEARESSYRRMDEALRAALSKRDTLSDHCSDLQKRLGESTLQVKRLEATQASVTRQIGDSAARLDEVRAEGEQQHVVLGLELIEVQKRVCSLETALKGSKEDVIMMRTRLQDLTAEVGLCRARAEERAIHFADAEVSWTEQREAGENALADLQERLTTAVRAAQRMQNAIMHGMMIESESAQAIELEHLIQLVEDSCKTALSLRSDKKSLEESVEELKKERASAAAGWKLDLETVREQLETENSHLRSEQQRRTCLQQDLDSANSARISLLETNLMEVNKARQDDLRLILALRDETSGLTSRIESGQRLLSLEEDRAMKMDQELQDARSQVMQMKEQMGQVYTNRANGPDIHE